MKCKCGSSNINLERSINGNGWCNDCGFQVRVNGVDVVFVEESKDSEVRTLKELLGAKAKSETKAQEELYKLMPTQISLVEEAFIRGDTQIEYSRQPGCTHEITFWRQTHPLQIEIQQAFISEDQLKIILYFK